MRLAPRLAACILPLAIALLAGCNSITYSIHPVPTAEAQYRAYGDSITRGAGLSDPESQAYPGQVSAFESVTFTNNSVDGDMACDLATSQIFPNQDNPTLANRPTYTVMIGTNDIGTKPNLPSYQQVFIACHLGALTWLGIPAENKVLATSPKVVTHGPGAIDASNHWDSWTTAGPGASVSFPITLSSAGPIYAWPRIDDNSSATYTYSLDGVELGSRAVQTNPRMLTKDGGTNSMILIRIPGVPAGKHVVTFTQTNEGSEGVSVVGIAAPVGLTREQMPLLLVGIIPFEENNGHGGRCTSVDEVCNEYIQDIEDDEALLLGDGLNLRIFNSRNYMFATPSEMVDASHPNLLGHAEIAKSVEAVW